MERCPVQTAGDLCRRSGFVEDDVRNKEIFQLFENEPGLYNIPVLNGKRVVGLINRDHFMRCMARRFHWELYAEKRCRKLMDDAPIVVEAETSIGELADLLLKEGNSYSLSDGFVIKRGAEILGTGLSSDVLAALLVLQKSLASELVAANARLRELATTDPLTGLHNRRRFNEVLAAELKRARRDGRPLGLIMVDIDHFKKLNDRLGHQAGDEALRQVAAALRGALQRASDACFRIGGEEFAVLALSDSREALAALAEKLRAGVEALRLANPEPPLGIVTISLGAVVSASGGESPDAIYERADRALYAAKGGGRNRVVVAAERP